MLETSRTNPSSIDDDSVNASHIRYMASSSLTISNKVALEAHKILLATWMFVTSPYGNNGPIDGIPNKTQGKKESRASL